MKFKYGDKFHPVWYFILMMSCLLAVTAVLYINGGDFMGLFEHPKGLSILIVTPISIILWLYNLYKSWQANKHEEFIKLNDSDFSFITNSKKETVKYDDVEKMWSIVIDDSKKINNRQFSIVIASRQKYDFQEEKFENKNEYERFISRMKYLCKNVSAK